MPWYGTRLQGGQIQRCALCGEKVHRRDTVKHDREKHGKETPK